jgi:TatD DNase family protein
VSRSRNSQREGAEPPAPEPLPIPVADAHCHLDIMGADVATAITAAAAVGVTQLVTIGCDLPSSRFAAEAARAHDAIFAAVAIHPNEVGDGIAEGVFAELTALAADPRVLAIGETGLDHFRTEEGQHRAQEESFRRHIALAKELNRTVVVHDRDAHDDVIRVLDSEGAPERTVIHCFSGDEDFARKCADRGWFMSFAGNMTFKNAQQLRDAARIVPAELLLVETDAPFLTAMPFRGRPNAPYLIPLTMRALAETRGDDLAELCGTVAANGQRAFRMPTAA